MGFDVMDTFFQLNSPLGISILTKLKALSGKGRKCSWVRWQASAGSGLEGKETTLSAKGWWITFMKVIAFKDAFEG